MSPSFRGNFAICFGEPLNINDHQNLPIDAFNKTLNEKMLKAELIALKNVVWWFHNQLILDLINNKNMKFLKLISTFLIFYGISLFPNLAYSESIDPNKYKVLSSTN